MLPIFESIGAATIRFRSRSRPIESGENNLG
jgi:hypothetical protein